MLLLKRKYVLTNSSKVLNLKMVTERRDALAKNNSFMI